MTRRDYGSGSIEERSAGRWRIIVESPRDPVTGKRQRNRFTVRGNKRDAQRALRQALTERDQRIDVRPDKITVGQYLKRWLNDYAAATVSDRTLAGYRQQCRRLSALIGPVRLRKLSPAQIQAAYASLGEELSNRTVLHHHRRLKQALKRGHLGADPDQPGRRRDRPDA